jgi:hypothetical protein
MLLLIMIILASDFNHWETFKNSSDWFKPYTNSMGVSGII